MIDVKVGDIFTSTCDVIVNPTNSIGVMGKGLAKEFHKRYPDICNNFNCFSNSYQMNYRKDRLMPPMLYEKDFCNNDRAVLMFPTKIHWRNPSEYAFIMASLDESRSILEKHQSPSVAFPAIGCGLGNLSFKEVLSRIELVFKGYSNKIEVYMKAD